MTATISTRLLSIRANSSIINSPLSSIGITRSFARCASQSICHGTMFE
jgi:hypothetical protein